MKYYVNPGRKRKMINFSDHIIYSRVKDLDGNDLDLDLSIMSANGNIEMRTAAGSDPEADAAKKYPVILWISGGGFRGVDKNQMIAETQFLADAGYMVVSAYYRSSAQGKFPAQIQDVKTAIRFLRAHADRYQIDSERIGIMGRSAGGYLAAMAAMNTDEFNSAEWAGYSSHVQAAYDMFGPVDISGLLADDAVQVKENPHFRWQRLADTHAGALIGGEEETMLERAAIADVNKRISAAMCPLLIAHGDSDPMVPCRISETFYEEIVAAGFPEKADLYILENGGHGSPEFFQESMRAITLDFFKKHLS